MPYMTPCGAFDLPTHYSICAYKEMHAYFEVVLVLKNGACALHQLFLTFHCLS